MATTRQTEIERKYDVTGDGGLPDLSGIEGVGSVEVRETVELEAVYVDTERGDLASAAITMRRRTGGKDEGWHVKLPAGAGRTEVHAPLAEGTIEGDRVRAPEGLLEAVRLVVRGRALVPVARIRTRRTATILRNAEGAEVAEVADDAVTATDLRSGEERSWHEIEAELLGVDEENAQAGGGADSAAADRAREDLLDAIERALLGAGAVPSASRSKLARALGRDDLVETGGGDAPSGDASAGDAAAWFPRTALDAVTASLRGLVADLVAADPAVRRDDPESVHEMRKVVRRLRSVLAASRGVLDRESADALRARLSSLGRVLGEARDVEVRAQRAATEIEALPAELSDRRLRGRLEANARREYRRAHDRLLAFLSGAEYFALLDALDGFVAEPPAGQGARRQSGKALRRSLAKEAERSLSRAKRARGLEGRDALPALHAARKAARRLRYAAEAAEAGGGIRSRAGLKRVAALAEAAEAVQDILGEHRDSATFAEHVLAESGHAHAAGEPTFSYGVIFIGARRAADEAEAGARKAVRTLRRAAKKL